MWKRSGKTEGSKFGSFLKILVREKPEQKLNYTLPSISSGGWFEDKWVCIKAGEKEITEFPFQTKKKKVRGKIRQ